jgi:hypothetical protein
MTVSVSANIKTNDGKRKMCWSDGYEYHIYSDCRPTRKLPTSRDYLERTWEKMKTKLRCRCGGIIERKETFVEGFLLTADVCSKCGELGLPLKSAQELLRLREEAKRIDARRKIVRIGNSIGITLPHYSEKVGFKEGGLVDIRLIGDGEIAVRTKGAGN